MKIPKLVPLLLIALAFGFSARLVHIPVEPIDGAKQAFHQTLTSHISPPESFILGAIVLGEKQGLSFELKDKLNRAGVRHITAISGMHVALLTMMLMWLFLAIGLWRWQAFCATLFLILVFIVLTGSQPSAIRAGIMGSSFLFAQVIGRMNVSLRMLIFSGVSMVAYGPDLLENIGFQLSFLAVFGIITIVPILSDYAVRMPNVWHMRDIFLMSIAAQVFTLPVLIFNFGQISVISVFVNLLVVPVIPFVLALGFLFLIGGTLAEPLAYVLSLPVSVFLHYITFVVNFFSSLPFAAVQVSNVSPYWFVFLYAPILFLIFRRRTQQKSFDFLP